MVSSRGKRKTASPIKTSESNEVAENASHSLTGNARGKNKTDSPNKSSEANEVAENEEAEGQASQSLTVNMEELNEDGQFEDKVETPVEETGIEGYGEMPGEEESVKAKAETDDWNLKVGSDKKVALEQNSSEDDELDDQEDQMWEDDEESSEEDDEENVADEDGVSDEDSIKEDDDMDEVSVEDDDAEDEVSADEEDDGKDEGSRDETTEVAKVDENKAKAKEEGGEAKPKEDGEEAKAKEDGREAKAKEDEKEAKEHDGGKLEEGLKNDKNSNKNIRTKKVKVAVPKKVDSKDKPESSQKSKGKKRVESMGMIFMCSSKTRSDCFQYKVLGLPESKKDIVEKIYSGMRLFLYDVDLKLLHGIFKAAGPGGYNLEPKAFKSQFPSQVRYVVLDDCLPLPEEKFKKVIKENYFSKKKFDCQLKAEQVKQLCKLFVTSSKGHLPKKVHGPRKGHKAENPNSVGPETSRRRRVGDKRHPALEEEPRFRERPHKRPRKVITSPRRRPLPARKAIINPRHQPRPALVSSYAYERTSNVDGYNRRDQYSYRDRRDLSPVTLRDPYRDVLDPSPVIRGEPYLERAYPYRDGRDLYVERRDPYIDGRDTYARRHHDPYTDGPASYLERRDPNIGLHSSSYREGRASYLERRDLYREPAFSVPYSSTYRRDPPSDARDAYREDPGGEYRSSLRREEVLERGGLHPLTVETRYHPDIRSRDPYADPTRQLTSYADPIYSAEYPSRVGLAREYRL